MDNDFRNLHLRSERKLSSSLQYALILKGTPFGKSVAGGLEFPFYETYDFYLNHFLQLHHTLTVSPQYRISKLARDDEAKDEDDEDDVVKRAPRRRATWPDFVIVRSMSERNDGEEWKFLMRTVLVVVEVKPLCDDIPLDYNMKQIEKALQKALLSGEKQAKLQAKYVFASSPTQQHVFAIHGAGPFWRYNIYEKETTSPVQGVDEDEAEFVLNRLKVSPSTRYPKPSPLQKLGTEASLIQFVRMLSLIKTTFGIGDGW